MDKVFNDIAIDYDEYSGCYFIIWQPFPAVGAGDTKQSALDDLREAIHAGVDTLINLASDKLK